MMNEVTKTEGLAQQPYQVIEQMQTTGQLPQTWWTSNQTWQMLAKLCGQFANSNMVPSAYRDEPGNVMVAMAAGLPLGLSPLACLQSVAVINGKPTLYGDAPIAQVLAHPSLHEIKETHGGSIKGMFGKSEAQKEAEKLIATFEDTVIASLDQTQRAEAGGRRWAQVVIGVRDAYLLAGRSSDEASAAVGRLWEAQKRGPAAVQVVMDSIQKVLDLAAEIQKLTDDSIQGLEDLVAEGKRSGELLPEHLEPYLATLVEVGKLTQSDMDLLMKMANQATYDWREVQAAADRYGVSVEHLGKRFQAAKFGERSAQIAADWELMAVKGAKANKVARAMAPTVQETIDQYQKAGIKIPHELRNIIEKQISMGLLEDENGRKLKSSSEIEFAAPIVSELDKLIKAIEGLINKLTGRGGVVDSFHKVNDTQIEDKEFTVTENRNVTRTGGGTEDDSMFMRHGTGGRYVDFGAGTPAVLHGKERVMTEAEGKSEVASMHGVEKRLTSIERLLKDQPRAFGLAMSDTMNLIN